MKQARIYVNDIYCGILTEDEEGFHFSYNKEYLARQDKAPISPTMPLTELQYDKVRNWKKGRKIIIPVVPANSSPVKRLPFCLIREATCRSWPVG